MSNVSVSMKLSPKQAGKLYILSLNRGELIRQLDLKVEMHEKQRSDFIKTISTDTKTISDLQAENKRLREKIKGLTDV